MNLLKELNEMVDPDMPLGDEWTRLTPEQEQELISAVRAEMTPGMDVSQVTEIVLGFMEDIPGLEVPDEDLAGQIALTAMGH